MELTISHIESEKLYNIIKCRLFVKCIEAVNDYADMKTNYRNEDEPSALEFDV